MNKMIKTLVLIGIITVIAAFGLSLIGKQMTANAIKELQEQVEYREWLAENCECLEQNRFFCNKDFLLNGSWCSNGKQYTNRLKACSMYNCSGEIKEFNFELDKWIIE